MNDPQFPPTPGNIAPNQAGSPPAPGGSQPSVPPSAPGTQPVVQTKQIGKYRVEVSREKCIGAASCVAIAPLVFELDEQNIARIISQDGNDDDTKLLAAQSCPTAAITVVDTTTGQQVWPVEVQ